MPEDVVVISAGMISAVGLSAPETAASVRSATALFSATSILDHQFEPFVLGEVVEDGLPDLAEGLDELGLTAREARMLRLAGPAIEECLKALPPSETPPPLVLALPDIETTKPLEASALLTFLLRQVGPVFDLAKSDARHRGRAGGLAAIDQAAAEIRAGRAKFMLAGGVDTYRDLYVLGTLDMIDQRVKSVARLDGFIPGEGAGFVLLTSRSHALSAGLVPLVRISALSQALEPGHLYSEEPYKGEGLALAVQQLITSGGISSPIQEVYSSMNGENHWAKEWGVTRIRSSGTFATEHGMHHPADCFGDTGAAAGPLLVGLAALGISGGYRRSPALVYASSDRGPRAALAVSAA